MRFKPFDSSLKLHHATWAPSTTNHRLLIIIAISYNSDHRIVIPQTRIINFLQTTHLLVIIVSGAATRGLPALATRLLRLLGARLEGTGRGLAALGCDLALVLVSICSETMVVTTGAIGGGSRH